MRKWDETLWLFTQEEFDKIPDDLMLKTINGTIQPKSKLTSKDTRYGMLAYGLTQELAKQQNYEKEFLVMLLKS